MERGRGGPRGRGRGRGGGRPPSEGSDRPEFTLEEKRAYRDKKRKDFKDKQMQSYDSVSSRPEGQSKSGNAGDTIQLVTNYIKFEKKAQWVLYHYHVDFNPPLKITKEKKFVLRAAITQISGMGAYIFDGHSIWSATKIISKDDPPIELQGKLKNDSPIALQVKLVQEIPPGDIIYLQFYSILVRKCFAMLKLDMMGRHFYDAKQAISIEHHRLELWPGFITSLRQHDGGLLYCVEMTHKVIRTESVLDVMARIRSEMGHQRGCGMDEIKEAIKKELVGTIIITTYNNLTYRVDDISWNENASSTFPLTGGGETSYVEYFKQRYNVEISSNKQPLLVSNPKKEDVRRGRTMPYKLIPELCRMTGLTTKMRSNFNLMKDMAQYMFAPPQKKADTIRKFITRLYTNTECQREIEGWGLKMLPDLVDLQGRVIPKEGILFSDGSGENSIFPVDQKGDFTMALRSNQMATSKHLNKWVVIVPQREAANLENLIRTMKNVGRTLGFQVAPPLQTISLNSIQSSSYVDAVNQAVTNHGKELQMVFVILVSNKIETYAAVKRRCYVDYGIPSQCFLTKNVTSKGLMSIATKVVVQMNAKLGGEPWNVKIPLRGLMVVGFDVYHAGAGRSKRSIGAMTCTITETHGRFFSVVSFYSSREELSGNMASDITKCIYAWKQMNNESYPARIVFYREGVGEGQLHYVYHTELTAIKTQLSKVYGEANLETPKLTYIVCTKRINTRVFFNGRSAFENPPPGTVMDSIVTLPERWDFYLIAHSGRQGTVSPTCYNVLWDGNMLDSDKIQRLTYKMCHLYYNWSGAVAVPAVCQYAHKLAYLTGMATKAENHTRLGPLLYFL